MRARPQPDPGVVLRVALSAEANPCLLIVSKPTVPDEFYPDWIHFEWVGTDDGRRPVFNVDPVMPNDSKDLHFQFGNPNEAAYAVLNPAKWDDFLGGGYWLESA